MDVKSEVNFCIHFYCSIISLCQGILKTLGRGRCVKLFLKTVHAKITSSPRFDLSNKNVHERDFRTHGDMSNKSPWNHEGSKSLYILSKNFQNRIHLFLKKSLQEWLNLIIWSWKKICPAYYILFISSVELFEIPQKKATFWKNAIANFFEFFCEKRKNDFAVEGRYLAWI